MRSETLAAVVEAGSHEAAYQSEQIVIAISVSTLSSTFAGVAQLTSLGAESLAILSAQASVSFDKLIEKTLPNTGLSVRIAGTLFHWIPDPGMNILQLNRKLTSD